MQTVLVYHYDAFCNQPGKGNPAGIVMENEYLTDEEMQEVASKVGFNETAFVVKSARADLGIRYFTPGHEMNLCGHGTIATLYCMKTRGMLEGMESLTIDTKAGVLPIQILSEKNDIKIRMGQASPEFKAYHGSIEALAHALGIDAKDIDTTLPIVYGSTGTWTLLAPIKKLETFSRMKPQNTLFPDILTEMPRSSIHPFCLETIHPNRHMHSRHFSSPYSGTTEDAVTGTASGVMGAYYARYIQPDATKLELIMEQGQELNRDGAVFVHLSKQDAETKVEISGTAIYVDEIT
ncbi:MAG: PhzF family phenazine biosynthesis protein, partial [Gorillibacterium sp.]|nr:PhzF family phenazine biosynthesis protein [Gorillibacterium sp.]